MRDIKFRAWNPKNLLMFEVYIADLRTSLNEFLESLVEKKGFLLMQFTGLCDSGGKEIFEGDVVRVACLDFEAEVAEVIWTKKYLGFGLRSQASTDPMLPHLIREIKVIGNIHQNPELLKA